MSADLEREAREAAVGRYTSVPDWASLGAAKQWELQDRERHFEYGYLAAAALREKEIEGQRHFFNLATEEIATLRARVEELEGMVPKWVPKGEGKIAPLVEMGWQGVCDSPDEWQRLMVPPIPVPETKA